MLLPTPRLPRPRHRSARAPLPRAPGALLAWRAARALALAALLATLAALGCGDATTDRVLVIVNGASPVSRAIGDAYVRARGLDADRVLALDLPTPDPSLRDRRHEVIDRAGFESLVAAPLRAWLEAHDPDGEIDILVTTKGVPLRIDADEPPPRDWVRSYAGASVDAELAVLDGPLALRPGLPGSANPFYDWPGSFADFRARTGDPRLRFLVARITSFQDGDAAATGPPADVVALLSAAQGEVSGRGTWLVDRDPSLPTSMSAGNLLLLAPTVDALRAQGIGVRDDRLDTFVGGADDLRGYASWGSNDGHEPATHTYGDHDGVPYPGRFAARSIASDLVSTNARTFTRPAEYGQSLVADLIRAGASAATGHVAEPTLGAVARPYVLLPRFAAGELAIEAYFKSLPYLGWTNVFVGDPLMQLPPEQAHALGADRDGDQIPDDRDNCLHLANTDQRDTDGDAIGNLCDADVDGDGVVTTSFGRIFPVSARGDVEWIALTARNGPYDPDHDLDGDGFVNDRDVAIAQIGLFRAPGPSRRSRPRRGSADGS